jgi:hypothetical protein
MPQTATSKIPAGAHQCSCPPWGVQNLDELCPVCAKEWSEWCLAEDIRDHLERFQSLWEVVGAPGVLVSARGT